MESLRFALILCLMLVYESAVASELEKTSQFQSTELTPAVMEESGGQATSSDQAEAEGASDRVAYKYIGNAFSMKFHRPSCPFARAMWRSNVVRFQFRKEAITRGFKPCKYCLPQSWKSVGAKILKAEPRDENCASSLESATQSSCKEARENRRQEGVGSSKSAIYEENRSDSQPAK